MANKTIGGLTTATPALNTLVEIELADGTSGKAPLSDVINLGAGTILDGNADVPPLVPNALDDEFEDSATLPGGISAKWTWVNQGAATATISTDNCLLLTLPVATSQNLRCLVQTTPATPWTIKTKVYVCSKPGTDYSLAGLVLRESSTGKMLGFSIGFNSAYNLRIHRWNSSTSYSIDTLTTPFTARIGYFKITDDGTNLAYAFSDDGLIFIDVFIESRTAFLTGGPNQFGVCAYCENVGIITIGKFTFFRRT